MMITRLLVANRGEIACRIMRTARDMGIETVAVYADPDAAALHVASADLAIALPGTTAAETYLVVDALLDAARRSGADALHPGYGFLAENADFARAVIDAGLTWVGPPPEAIAAMGDKLSAKRLMAEAGVPTLVSVTDPAQAEEVGYPLIVKASAGGGGKGMRIVSRAADLDDAVAAARREAAASFGDDTVFLERYLTRPRHIEVQVMADGHGTVVHIGERECSLQRRHQKVLEEAPSPVVDDATRARLGKAAVAAARAIGYEGAGTVEFVSTADGNDFFFLEVNTRLQVEHPVTELAWRVGADEAPLDLVRLQLLVAAGEPLPFGQDDLRLAAHAVEARLYAEDPAAGFLPATGTVELLDPANLAGTRWDTGVMSGDEISPWFDPMVAKVVATAATRTEAVRLLALELQRTRLHGVTTNRDALVAMLTHPAFVAGDLHTGFIDEHLPADVLAAAPDAAVVTAHVIAAALCAQAAARAAAAVQTAVPSGWRSNISAPQADRYSLSNGGAAGDEPITVTYLAPRWDEGWTVTVDGDPVSVQVHHLTAEGGDLTVAGVRTRATVARLADDGPRLRFGVDSALGHTTLVKHPRLPVPEVTQEPGSLLAPMPGAVRQVAVATGDVVAEGDLLLVLEAMKMEHRVTAPTAGTVTEVGVSVGDQVQAGAVLAVIDDGSQGSTGP
ncbi:biotin carboxylase N-terminal domain-containing protein [soil metagenome]